MWSRSNLDGGFTTRPPVCWISLANSSRSHAFIALWPRFVAFDPPILAIVASGPAEGGLADAQPGVVGDGGSISLDLRTTGPPRPDGLMIVVYLHGLSNFLPRASFARPLLWCNLGSVPRDPTLMSRLERV